MHSGWHMKIGLFAALVCCSAGAQQRNSPSRPGAAEGELTVTATVVASVGIVIDENGKPRVIVANAPDPADNASALHLLLPMAAQRKDKKPPEKSPEKKK